MNLINLSPITTKIIEQASTGKKLSGRLTSQIPENDKIILMQTYNVDNIIASIYCLVNDVQPTICLCGNKTKFQSFSVGFRKSCSVSCSLKSFNKTNNITKNKNKAKDHKQSILEQLNFCVDEYKKEDNLKTISEIAKQFGVTNHSLRKHLSENGLIIFGDIHKKRQNKKMLDNFPELFDNNFFKLEQDKNKNSKVLAKELGLSPNTLCVYARNHELPFPNQNSISSAEFELSEFFGDTIKLERNIRTIITPYEIDLYLPEFKLGIEYNGAYWHSEEKGKDKHYHITKQKLAEENNIKLIQIFDFEWENKKEQIKGYLNSLINKNINVIYGRNTTVKEISKIESKLFLDQNHIHGSINAKYNFGLFHNNELISVLTLGKSRFTKKYDFEVLRFCTKIGFRIIGGLSKFIKFIKNNLTFNTIVSYSHRRLFNGESFIKAGFALSHKTEPGYFWANKYTSNILPRYKTQKHKLNTVLTESQYMTSKNFVKVWDCGQLVFVLNNSIINKINT
jgi:predicted DNA binding protein